MSSLLQNDDISRRYTEYLRNSGRPVGPGAAENGSTRLENVVPLGENGGQNSATFTQNNGNSGGFGASNGVFVDYATDCNPASINKSGSVLAPPTASAPLFPSELSTPLPSPPLPSNSNKRKIAFYVAIVCFGFGISMFINGIANRLLPPSALVEAVVCSARVSQGISSGSLVSPPLFQYVLASMIDPIYILAAGRSIALVFILIVLLWLEKRNRPATAASSAAIPMSGEALAQQNPSAEAALTTSTAVTSAPRMASPNGMIALNEAKTATPQQSVLRQLVLPLAVGLTNCLAYAAYMSLTSLAGVAIWSAMVGCYVVLPASYGIFVRGESRSKRKLLGIGCCVLAAVLLGLAGGESNDGDAPATVDVDGPWWLKLFLYGASIFFWSCSDGISAYMLKPPKPDAHGRVYAEPLPLTTITAFTSIGFGLSAALFGGLAMVLHMYIRTPLDCPQPSTDSAAGGYVLMFIAQILGKIAWIAIVKLGSIGEASSFIPLIGLDVFIPSLLGVIILQEQVGLLGYLGMALAAVGVALISSA